LFQAEVTKNISTAASLFRCTPLMRIILLFSAIILTLTATGQDSANLTLTLKFWNTGANTELSRLDTVWLNSTEEHTIKIYTVIRAVNSTFRLSDIAPGKYWLKFSIQQFCATPTPIVVCSRCENEVTLIAFPKISNTNCDIFNLVELNPTYTGGNKALAKDFQKTLTTIEMKSLQSGADFTVHFFLTKQKTISDITFTPSDLPQKAKDIIIKGLTFLTHWNTAMINGGLTDEEYIISKHTLLDQ
jgi:hypothetical protein